jgi:hypothetical protein
MRGCLVDAAGEELAGGGLFIEFPAHIVPPEKRRYSEIVRLRWISITPEEGDSVAELRSATRTSFEFLDA